MRAVSLISSDRSIISSRWAPKYVCQTSANFSPAACSESLHSLRSLTMRAPPVMDSVAGCDDAPRKRPGARLAGEGLYGPDLPRQDLALAQSGSRNFPLHVDDEARFTGRLPALHPDPLGYADDVGIAHQLGFVLHAECSNPGVVDPRHWCVPRPLLGGLRLGEELLPRLAPPLPLRHLRRSPLGRKSSLHRAPPHRAADSPAAACYCPQPFYRCRLLLRPRHAAGAPERKGNPEAPQPNGAGDPGCAQGGSRWLPNPVPRPRRSSCC